MKTIICLALCSTVAAAQDYRGSGEIGGAGLWLGNQFHTSCDAIWTAQLNVDRSQNVTFRELSMDCVGHYDFDGHQGNVYMDYEVHIDVDPTTLDLNPIPNPTDNLFRVIPFHANEIKVSGSYHNRGFESAFETVAKNNGGNWWDFALDYSKFPDEIGLVSLASFSWRYDFPDRIELEPFLFVDYVHTGLVGPGPSHPYRFQLTPVPPEPVKSTLGDSNLDGKFDSGDLVQVFQAGEYEDSIIANSTWEEGDWNLDMDFDSGDLVTAFTAGTYADSPAGAVAEVPEPSGLVAVVLGMLLICSKVWRW